jgi:hypothetical protein
LDPSPGLGKKAESRVEKSIWIWNTPWYMQSIKSVVFLSADVEYEYEEAVQECGYGRFHYILLLVCGWANASDAVEVPTCPVHA